jgi:hypothetical protein
MSKVFSGIPADFADENSRGRLDEDTNGSSSRSVVKNNNLNESISGVVTSFTVYKLLSELIKPITALPAYKLKIIDERCNYLKDPNSVNLSAFDRMVIGIKRLILSTGSSKLRADYSYFQTAAKAMAFECVQLGGNEALFLEEIYKCVDVLLEDGEAAGNAIGGGFLNPQVGEANPALAGYSPPLGLKRRTKKELRDVIIKS